ncbi:MAG TPA: NUDIX domain-containing protein [Candidatus Binatia bacterium]|nr:NUDIX domain-containing protein [Candidatus Binatia bacterium]
MSDKIFYVSTTGIVVKDGKFLIAKRSEREKAFPGKWTVPGGKFQHGDYHQLAPNKGGLWYEPVERALRREIKEEVNLDIDNIRYVTNITFVRPDAAHCLILSYACDYVDGDVVLCDALTDHAWVSLAEAKKYDLIDGIYDELAIVDKQLNRK